MTVWHAFVGALVSTTPHNSANFIDPVERKSWESGLDALVARSDFEEFRAVLAAAQLGVPTFIPCYDDSCAALPLVIKNGARTLNARVRFNLRGAQWFIINIESLDPNK